ncbi:MAG: hypothetical protein ACPGVY_08730, partial [Mycobacterium sp.]
MTGLRAAVDVLPSAQRWTATPPWVRRCPTSTFLVLVGRRFWSVAWKRSVSLLSLFSEVCGVVSVLVLGLSGRNGVILGAL